MSNMDVEFHPERDYNDLSEKFCKVYYHTYDHELYNLGNYFSRSANITFLDNEVRGFENMYNGIRHMGINKFEHNIIQVQSQPVNGKTVILTVFGQLKINYESKIYHFVETITLVKEKSGKIFIHNCMFQLVGE